MGQLLGGLFSEAEQGRFSPSLMMLSGLPAPCHIASGLPTLLLRQKLPKQQLFYAHINSTDGQRIFFSPFFIAHFLLRKYCFPAFLFKIAVELVLMDVAC